MSEQAKSVPQLVFEPGGYAKFSGEQVPLSQRLLSLVGVFARDAFRTTPAKLGAALYLVAPLCLGAWLVIRSYLPDLPVSLGGAGDAYSLWKLTKIPTAGQAGCDIQALEVSFAVNAFLLLLGQATQVAPLLARDAHQGALLLYFSRPVLRSHYLLARLAAAAGIGTALMTLPSLLLVLVELSQHGLQPGGCPWPGLAGVLWWLALCAVVALCAVAVAVATSLVALAAGVLVRNPSAAPLALGGLVLGSLALSWILQSSYGRESLARGLDLHHALQAPWFLLTWLLSPNPPPKPVLEVALLGLLLWTALATLGWFLLQRFLRNPPLGKGRA